MISDLLTWLFRTSNLLRGAVVPMTEERRRLIVDEETRAHP